MGAQPGDNLILAFSGYGAQQPCTPDSDQYEAALVPCDFAESLPPGFFAGVVGPPRHHHRIREAAIAAMVQESAQLRLERALASKSRITGEQLELQPGDLVDFWRKVATKEESGWRGPAKVVEPPDPAAKQAVRQQIGRAHV